MRLILLGNGPFAVPTLKALDASSHDVRCAVARPPRVGRGRHKSPPPSPMQQAANELNIEVLTPPTVNEPAVRARLAAFEPELFVVCDYGEILRRETIDLPPRGAINLHGSLLPKYRGAAPVAWAIYHGESETGNTVFQLTPGVDAGPILATQTTPIDPDETARELEARLATLGAALVVNAVDQLETNSAAPQTQNAALATKAPRLKKTDGVIDWNRTARQIKNQIRAMQPWPKAFTFWLREDGESVRLILSRVEPVNEGELAVAPGIVLEADRRLLIGAGDAPLEVIELQPAGKRAMSAAEFLRGHAVQPGDTLGTPSEGA